MWVSVCMHAMCAYPQLVCCQFFLFSFFKLFRVHNSISVSYILGCDATYVYMVLFSCIFYLELEHYVFGLIHRFICLLRRY